MKKIKRLTPLLIVLLANLIGFGVLFFSEESLDASVLYFCAALLAVVLVSYAIILFGSLGDEYLFLIVSMIFTIGIISLFRLNKDVALHQILYYYVGMAGFFAVYTVYRKADFWDKPAVIKSYIAASFLLFAVTLLFGRASGGAKNWLGTSSFGIQPSEIIKLLFILALAGLYTEPYKTEEDGYKNKLERLFNTPSARQIIIMAVAYMHIGFLVLQREWGSALLYFMIYFTMQYVFGKGALIMVLNVLLAGMGSLVGIKTMTHIQQRISIWRDPFANAGDLGYQIVQSLYAMASGGITGSGLGLGHPEFVPLAKNDFIFAEICEELGMIGAVGVVMLFFMLTYRGVKIALRTTKPFNKVVALGISAMYGYQTFIIIGGVTKFIPLTGITLPFVSAGGSSLASCFAALAILQAISSKREELSDVIE